MIKYKDDRIEEATKLEILKFVRNASTLFIDTETTIADNPKLLTIQLGNKNVAYLIDVRNEDALFLKPYLESDSIKKVGHNIKFDYKVLKSNLGIQMENVHCTMVGEMVLSTGLTLPKKYLTLEHTFKRYFGYNPYGTQLDLFRPYTPKAVRDSISENLYEEFSKEQLYYMFLDIITVNGIYDRQIEALTDNDLLETSNFENEYTLCLGDKELNGIYLDKDNWRELYEYSKEKSQHYLSKLLEHRDINWNSHTQVKPVFRELGISMKYKDKETIEEKVLSKYRETFKIVDDYLRYKKYSKLHGTYGEKFLRHVGEDNRIHPDYYQIVDTGRISCRDPNMQNIPSTKEGFEEGNKWREAFKPQDKAFIIADYDSQELRILSVLSKEDSMIEAFKNKMDLHALTASRIFNKEVTKTVNSELRKIGKTLNFAIAYGASAPLIAERLNISVKEASDIIKKFYKGYPKLREYFDNTYYTSIKNGYILIDDIIRRKVYIKDIERARYLNERDKKSFLESVYRHCQNYKIQGNGANITKLAEIYLRNKLKENKHLYKVVLSVHDELVLESNYPEEAADALKDCMEKAAKVFGVDIPADTLINTVWIK